MWLESKEICDMLSPGIASGVGKFVDFRTINATLVGEKKQPIMSGCGKEVFDDVILFGGCAFHAFAAATL